MRPLYVVRIELRRDGPDATDSSLAGLSKAFMDAEEKQAQHQESERWRRDPVRIMERLIDAWTK